MSRRYDDRYEDRSNLSRRPRGGDYDEVDVNIRESRNDGPAPARYDPPPQRRAAETMVRERETDTVISQGRRTERGARQPDFLREDYGRTDAGPLVVREDRVVEDDYVSRAPPRRRSMESMRSRRPPPPRSERVVDQEEIYIRDRERDNAGPPYPRSERGSFGERDEVTYRDRARSRPPPSNRGDLKEEIDIRIREDDRPNRPPPPRDEVRERDTEEIRIRRGDGGRPPPPREVEREEVIISRDERSRPPPPPPQREVNEEITIRDTVRSPPPREQLRGREREEIDINIRDRSAPPPPRPRSQSRGALVRKDHEEWIVRRRRTPSPSPSPSPPPPPTIEREQIVIRRRERTPSPEPVREPTPEPPPPPPPDAIYRPPIIQEVITHHRHIDHGIERARSPTPPPAPAPPSPPKEEDLEISIRRQGTRNGKAYDEEITFERDVNERSNDRQVAFRDASRDPKRDISRHRSVGAPVSRRRYDDDVSSEADYYNRRVTSRGYPGEAWNGATKDWGLVDIPPGTERVEMDGVGGGRQEITWNRYNGDRHGKFYTGDRVYQEPYGNGRLDAGPPPASLRPPSRGGEREDINIHITERSGGAEAAAPSRRRTRDRMWTEVTKDLVIKEAIEEKGYEYEETDQYFYVMEYLQYVRSLISPHLTDHFETHTDLITKQQDDVVKLVETTEDIRRQRRDRIRELQYEREPAGRPKMLPPPPPAIPPPPVANRGGYDERLRERDYYYDRERRYR